MSRGIWRTLGIEPTTDRSVIRRAYAAKLRAMDVEADPAGFARLRDARDAALAGMVDPVAMLPDLDDDSDDDEVVADGFFTPEPEPLPQARVDPVEAERDAAIDHNFRALEALLFPGHDDPSTAEEAAAIAHHGYALLADPRLERIDFAVGAERWFAEHLAIAIPRSDPLLERAAAVFGWIARRDDHTLSYHARQIVDRIGAIRFATLVGDPGHRLHGAWVELVRSDDGQRDWRTTKGRVRELLSIVRQRYPDAEQWMNPVRLAKWDRPASNNPRIGFYVWMAIIVIVAGLRIFLSPGGEPNAVPDTPPQIAYVADPNRIALDLTGLGFARTKAVNPDLAADIRSTATTINAGLTPQRTRQVLIDLANRRLDSGRAHAPDGLLRDIVRFEVDGKRNFATSDPIKCHDFQFPASAMLLPPQAGARQTALIHRTTLESNNRPVTVSRGFDVPGTIIEDMLRRTGIPESRLVDALAQKGEHADICRVQIALREAGLAGGNVGMKLLRNMQPKVIVPATTGSN